MARKKKKQTNAEKVKYKGRVLDSKLELFMFKLLEAEKIPFAYNELRFEIDEGFHYKGKSYEKFQNGRGHFKDRGWRRFNNAMYTPDFTPPVGEPMNWVIEVKGRWFPDFSRTWRLFKKLLMKERPDNLPVLFVPRTRGDCKKVVEILKRDVLCQTKGPGKSPKKKA